MKTLSRPYRILVLGGEITAPFLVLALRQLGYRVESELTALGTDTPDLVIGVNEKQKTTEIADALKIPRAVWFTDLHADIFMEPEQYSLQQNELEYLFCFSPQQTVWFRNAGMKRVAFLPPAVDPAFFCPDFAPSKLGSFLTFLGEVRLGIQNEMTRVLDEIRTVPGADAEACREFSDFLKQRLSLLAEDLTPIVPHCYIDKLKAVTPVTLKTFWDRIPEWRWSRAVENQLNAEQRVRLCRLLETQGLCIWGTLGDWERAGTWMCHAGRRADFFREWPAIIAGSTACINLFRPNPWHGVPQKVFEIAAGGSLVLTNHHPNLDSILTPGRECLAFHSFEECLEMVGWIHNNPDSLQPMRDAARKRVMAEHTYMHRARTLIGTLENEGFLQK